MSKATIWRSASKLVPSKSCLNRAPGLSAEIGNLTMHRESQTETQHALPFQVGTSHSLGRSQIMPLQAPPTATVRDKEA